MDSEASDTPRSAAAIDDLMRAMIGFASVRRDLRRRAGIGNVPGGIPALGAIYRTAPARVSDVAYELQVDLSVASRQVQALEAEGYIDRAPDPEDRRCSLVRLSALGEQRRRELHQQLTAALAEALAGWEDDEIQTLVDGLVRLRADLADAADTTNEERTA